jgi:hypothetical protein
VLTLLEPLVDVGPLVADVLPVGPPVGPPDALVEPCAVPLGPLVVLAPPVPCPPEPPDGSTHSPFWQI